VADRQSQAIFHFKSFSLDLSRGCLLAPGGAVIALRPKSFDLLHYVLKNAGRIVSRDELMEAVWPGVFVSDDSITQCVAEVRRALHPDGIHLLRTVPKRGYIFTAEIAELTTSRDIPSTSAVSNAPQVRPDSVEEGLSTAKSPTVIRRLAAILAADIVGYSHLTSLDEDDTFRRLKSLRAEVLEPLVSGHGGRIVSYAGDGAMAEFPSIVRAVECGLAIQAGVADREPDIPPDRRIMLRIGIHLGDIISDDTNDLCGDAVNIAARLEQLAEPGGICLSDRAHEEVASRLSTAFEFGGEPSLKNIPHPVGIWFWSPDSSGGIGRRLPPTRSEGRTKPLEGQIRSITNGADVVIERTARIETTQEAHGAALAELLEIARAGNVFQRAAEQGIPEAAIRSIVHRLGGEGIGRESLVSWLDNWIEAARHELGRRSNEGEAFETARREAERRFRQGRLAEASGAFMEELEREERAERERLEERKRFRLRLLEEAVRFDELALDGEAAVWKLRIMAGIEGIEGSDRLGQWLHEKATEFFERGDQRGENGALIVAIATYRSALHERTRERMPFEWAATQSSLGLALVMLGGRESGTAQLREAIATFKEALEEQTHELVPLQWAATQSNLGLALALLGERESGTARLEEAVGACKAALQERTRECLPLEWAQTMDKLGFALLRLGERAGGTAQLEEAVAIFRAALQERTRERVPLAWATTNHKLGTALLCLGERETGTARLEEAVGAYQAALEEYTRERVPLYWAMAQGNLGYALWRLGYRERGTKRLEEAVAAIRLSLEERTRDRVPFGWASTQNLLGLALYSLGEREAGTMRLEESAAAFQAALEELTRDRIPLGWADTQDNLGLTLVTLAEREGGTDRLEEAIGRFRAALEERTRERVPLSWATTQDNLGHALLRLGERESGTAKFEEAIAAYQLALEERTRERTPLLWARTQNNLGNALFRLGERENNTARLEEAVFRLRAALEERARDQVPHSWTSTQNNLGHALFLLGERKNETERLEEAAAAYAAALEERPRDRVPIAWAKSLRNHGKALALIAERRGDPALAEQALDEIATALEALRDIGIHCDAADQAMLEKARVIVRNLKRELYAPTLNAILPENESGA
jgi:class 3 adenylate cyclase/tetratricopeptide (TPR) repeat protein